MVQPSRRIVVLLSLLVLVGSQLATTTALADQSQPARQDHAVFFSSDGLRQDLVEKYGD